MFEGMRMPEAIELDFAEGAGAVVIGVMSGTSLDGLDLCAVQLRRSDAGAWSYILLHATSEPYPEAWKTRLEQAFHLRTESVPAMGEPSRLSPGAELRQLDEDYGRYVGTCIAALAKTLPSVLGAAHVKVDLVASHGHTVHHRPNEGYTLQIGSCSAIAGACGLAVVSDFRVTDVLLGGQGAPLVPLADRLLFGAYEQCLNLGGIANLSYEQGEVRVAYDLAPANLLLDRIARLAGLAYDENGVLAKAGQPVLSLLKALDTLPYYQQAPPKSLGREWLEQAVWPLVRRALGEANPVYIDKVQDLLATAVEHIAKHVAEGISKGPRGRVLVTGGGAFNGYLLARTQHHLPPGYDLTVPDARLVEQKEALAFALLGALRMRGEHNAWASVTGAVEDSCGGTFCPAAQPFP